MFHNRISRFSVAAAVVAALQVLATPPATAQSQNDQYRTEIDVHGNANLAAFPLTFAGNPVISLPASVTEWQTNLMLKFVPPVFEPPEHVSGKRVNVDDCHYAAFLKRSGAKYASVLTREFFPGEDSDWGATGAPREVFHSQTDVEVEYAINGELLHFENGEFNEAGFTYNFPVGQNRIVWSAHTMISDIMDIPPYWLANLSSLAKTTRTNNAVSKADEAARFVDRFATVLDAAGILDSGSGANLLPDRRHGVTNFGVQFFTVLDEIPPTLTTSLTGEIVVEAEDPGGVLASRHLQQLRDSLVGEDTCGREVEITLNQETPAFWPVNQTIDVIWDARDPGPNALGARNQATPVVHKVRVEDTLPPIVIAPPSRVIESDATLSRTTDPEEPAGTAWLGRVSVFDLADQSPTITDDAPATFAPDTRTIVTWAAEDDRAPVPNRTEKRQLITVKSAANPNTLPVAFPQAVDTRTFEETEITLQGMDQDLLSGLYDPISFSISTPPSNGFFVAPLYPYFIEDYRVQNDELEPGQNPTEVFCSGTEPNVVNNYPDDYLVFPEYVVVSDAGESFVLQGEPKCPGESNDSSVIKKFDADGNWLKTLPGVPFEVDRIEVGANGNLYYFTPGTGGTTETAFIFEFTPDLEAVDTYYLDTSSFNFLHAIFGPDGLIYATNGSQIIVLTPGTGSDRAELKATLSDDDPDSPTSILSGYTGSFNEVRATLALDPDRNLYASDPRANRIVKFEPSTLNDDSSVTPGEFAGWLGRCEAGRGCDAANARSFGFSCTYEDCTVGESAGSQAGQFDQVSRIVFDPQGKLYAADFLNERVQRFTKDGFVAGIAKSTCDGTCFVLGDFGRPLDVSVNSTHFYVLERDKDLLHVFETTPIESLDEETLQPEQSAKVTYKSNSTFVGTDFFEFTVSDGLASAAEPARVDIDVARNFRVPTADAALFVSGPEDEDIDISLSGADPDGDPITYEIVTQPRFGSLTGLGPDFVYTPDPDFYGLDSLEFRVSDQFSTSAPETVEIQVAPVNDLPDLDFSEVEFEAGAGYDYFLRLDIDDRDPEDEHELVIDWGDGSVEPAGTDADDDGRSPGLSKSPGQPGVIAARHRYNSFNSSYRVNVCVSEGAVPEPITTCETDSPWRLASIQVDSRDMMDVYATLANDLPAEEDEAGVERTAPVMDRTTFEYTLNAGILRPESGAYDEIRSENIVIEFEGDPEMAIDYVRPTAAECSWSYDPTAGSSGTCTLTALEGDAVERILIGVTLNGSVTEEKAVKMVAWARGDYRDPTDSSAADELTVQVDPNADSDGDGVPNGQDAFPNDPNESADTDADGVGNNADTDDDGDTLSDVWEKRYGLDPLDASDAEGDPDGDGISNLGENQLGTDPRLADTDRDTRDDTDDNCPVIFNRNQYDVDSDGIGTRCDADEFMSAATWADADGDGRDDVVVVSAGDTGQLRAYKFGSVSGEEFGQFDILDADWAPVGVGSLSGTDGLPTLLVLAQSETNGAIVVVQHDLVSGFETRRQNAFDATLEALAILALPTDASFAVLARDGIEGALAEVRDASGSVTGTARFEAGAEGPVAFAYVPDRGANGALALLATRESGEVVLQLRDRVSGESVGDFTVGDGSRVATAMTVVERGGSEQVAILFTDEDGRAVVEIRDPVTGMLTDSAGDFADAWSALGIVTMPQTSRYAVNAADAAGETHASIRDSSGMIVLADARFADAVQSARQLVAISNVAGDDLFALLSSDAGNVATIDVLDGNGTSLASFNTSGDSGGGNGGGGNGGGGTGGGGSGGSGGGGSTSLWALFALLLARTLTANRPVLAKLLASDDERAR